MGLTPQTTISLPRTILERWNRIEPSWRFAIVLFTVVRLFYTVWSWAIFTFQPLAVQNIELANEPILTIFNLKSLDAYTYNREIDSQVFTFQFAGVSTLRDTQTNSI